MSLAIVNKRLLTAWNKGISSNGKGQKILTKVRIFLKVISEICSVMGTIVSKYEPELVRIGPCYLKLARQIELTIVGI